MAFENLELKCSGTAEKEEMKILICFCLDDEGKKTADKWFDVTGKPGELNKQLNNHFWKSWFVKDSRGFCGAPFDEWDFPLSRISRIAKAINKLGDRFTEPIILFYLHLVETGESLAKFEANFTNKYLGQFESKKDCLIEDLESDGTIEKFLKLKPEFALEHLNFEEMINDGWFDERYFCKSSSELAREEQDLREEKEKLYFFRKIE